jgi:hypothetical protein
VSDHRDLPHAGSDAVRHCRQNSIAVVLNRTDEAVGSGASQRHGSFREWRSSKGME